MDSSEGHRVGEWHPGLVGHLLGPGPRLPRELAGGHQCRRATLGAEAASGHPLPGLWEELLKGMQGPFSLSGAPHCCPPRALGTRAQAGWP